MKNIIPAFSNKHKIRAWVRAGEYEVYVHHAVEQDFILETGSKRIISIEVEYKNAGQVENMSCRANQWHLFSDDGYCFDVVSDLFGSIYYKDRPYFGGDRIINRGRHARGWFAFDMPYDKKVDYLQFMNSIIGTRSVDIEIAADIETETPKDTTSE